MSYSDWCEIIVVWTIALLILNYLRRGRSLTQWIRETVESICWSVSDEIHSICGEFCPICHRWHFFRRNAKRCCAHRPEYKMRQKRCQEMLEKERKERRNGIGNQHPASTCFQMTLPAPAVHRLLSITALSVTPPTLVHFAVIVATHPTPASTTNPTPDARLAHALSFSFHLQPSNTQFPPRRSSLHDQDVPLS